MIPAFVSKDAVRRVCRDMQAVALIATVAFMFAILVAIALDAPQWLKVTLVMFMAEFAGGGVAANLICNKF